MSFSSTPLGQARRLDRDTFLGKPSANGNRPPSPRRIIPTSYSLTATTVPTAKQGSSTREPEASPNEPALARFARQKQREATRTTTTAASPLNPSRWSVKDTSVNIATAFNQAANPNADMSSYNPNHAWASTSRTTTHVPRSTSVEYEQQASATLQNRRLVPPNPNRFPGRGVAAGAKPASKNNSRSLSHIPDSEGEEQGPGGRAKSPFESVIESARSALEPAIFYLQQRSQDTSRSFEQNQPSANGSHAGNDSSYNYEVEEMFVQSEKEKQRAKPKKGRISVDNKAWKPSHSDLEESDEDEEPEKRNKRKKVQSIARLDNLPSIGNMKSAKKRRTKGGKGNAEDDGGLSDDNSQTDFSAAIVASQLANLSRPQIAFEDVEQSGEFSMNAVERDLLSLQSIPEAPEQEVAAASKKSVASEKTKPRVHRRSRSASLPPRSRPFSIGALLGTIIRYVISFFAGGIILGIRFLANIGFFLGRVAGTIYDIVINRPLQWVTGAQGTAGKVMGRYLVLGITILSAWYALQNPSVSSRLPSVPFPGSSRSPIYTPPSKPIENIDELVHRLARIESALLDLSLDNTKLKLKTEDNLKSYGDVLQRVGSVEGRITAEARRISETESRARESIGRSVGTVKQEIESLQVQLAVAQKQAEKERLERKARDKELEQRPSGDASDEEARARLRELEERVGGVEGGVKEALDLSKKLASTPPVVTAAPAAPSGGAAWWNKIISRTGTKDGLKITTPDGQDVTGLISTLVDSAVSVFSKDAIAKPDFALHSAGGRVIPSLTSPTYEIRPSTMRAAVFGALTGNGYASGHPPVTALEPSIYAGRCWPMAGTGGQLGIALAMPVYIDEITVDHVAAEVAFDMRAAPRQMEVWGLVEGSDNIQKLRKHRQDKVTRRGEELEAAGEMLDENWEKREWESFREGYPATLPRDTEYLKLAKFTYDIHAPKNVQTFDVEEEVKDLGLDFGIVVARVLNNWGHDTYTCLYRLRVHGQRMGELPAPYSEEQAGESS